MKNRRWVPFLTVALFFIGPGVLWADDPQEDSNPSASFCAAFLSQYISRGLELSKDSLVIQPSVTVGFRGFEINFWGNLDTNDKYTASNKATWNETDLTFSYTREIGPLKLTGGYIYYAFKLGDDTQELFLKAAGNFLLAPTLTIYRDMANYPGWYLNFGVSHSFNLSKSITLDAGASVGYFISETDKIVKYNSQLEPTREKYQGLNDGVISLCLNIPWGKYFTIKPMVAYSLALSDEARNLIKATSLSNNHDFFYSGVTLSLGF